MCICMYHFPLYNMTHIPGVVLAVEKRITSKLLVPASVKKLVKLDERKHT